MRRLLLAAGLLMLAACTGPTPTASVGEARFDGGTLAGSGNRTETDAGQTVAADSTGRGGTLAGSGN